MELLHDGEVRYTMHSERVGEQWHAFVLCTRQPPGETNYPRLGERYDLTGRFANTTAAYREAVDAARRLAAGEISAGRPSIKRKIREYVVIASAAYHVEAGKWEPVLKIESRRRANRGAIQDFTSSPSILQRNLCPTSDRATDFALEHGERVVLGLVPGLSV
jgi:hypothetical protein